MLYPQSGESSVMKHVLLLVAAVATLGGCNKSRTVDEKNATPAEVAQKVREAGADRNMIRPGLWQSKVTIEKFDMPGMPPEMAKQMKSVMAQGQVQDSQACLTAEDVRQPKEDFFAGRNNQCRYEHFTMGDGKIDAVMHCGKKDQGQTMRMAGTYSPDSYQMQMASQMSTDDQGAGTMQMQMRVDARRIGECGAKQ
jgi:hypothetical protein